MRIFDHQKVNTMFKEQKLSSKAVAREMRKRTGNCATTTQVDGWRLGRRSPSASNLMALADILGVSMEDLAVEVL